MLLRRKASDSMRVTLREAPHTTRSLGERAGPTVRPVVCTAADAKSDVDFREKSRREAAVRKIILLVTLASGIVVYGHAQSALSQASFRADNIERSGNTLTLAGNVVIRIDGFEVQTDKATVTVPSQPSK